jgi:hypothetical protein
VTTAATAHRPGQRRRGVESLTEDVALAQRIGFDDVCHQMTSANRRSTRIEVEEAGDDDHEPGGQPEQVDGRGRGRVDDRPAETVDEERRRVQAEQDAQGALHLGGREHDRAQVHPQRDDVAGDVADVAHLHVAGGEPEPEPEGEQHRARDPDRREQQGPGRRDAGDRHHDPQDDETDGEIDQPREQRGGRREDPREPHLGHELAVVDQARRRAADRARQVVPQHEPAEHEDDVRAARRSTGRRARRRSG